MTVASAAARLDHQRMLWANGFTLAMLVAWAVAGWLLPPYLVAGPWTVAVRIATFFVDPTDALHLAVSFAHVIGSVLIAFLLGSMLALANHYLPACRLMIQHRWYPFLNSFSGIGWAVLAVLLFGPSHTAVLFAIASTVVPFVFVNLREGLDTLDRDLLEMGQSFGRRGLRRFRLIVLPSLYPFIFAALRIVFGVAWKACLLAELYGSNQGLGYLVNVARQEFDSATIFAVIAMIITIVFVTDRWIFVPVQRQLRSHHVDT